MPASHWIGSTRNAHVSGVMAASSAAMSPYGMSVKPGVNGPKPLPVRRLGRGADQRDRAAVKVAVADDDVRAIRGDALAHVAPAPRGLDGGFDRFGAGVHRQHDVETGEARELLAEERQLVVVERARRQRDLVRLLDERREDGRVRVALVERRIRAQAIEIAPSLDVVDPHAGRAGDDDRQRVVVARAPAGLERQQILCDCLRGTHG